MVKEEGRGERLIRVDDRNNAAYNDACVCKEWGTTVGGKGTLCMRVLLVATVALIAPYEHYAHVVRTVQYPHTSVSTVQ